MSQILVDGGQLFIVHSSDGTPRHLFAELNAVRIDAGAHGGDELRERPLADEIEVGSERPQLPRHTAGQMSAMAFAAILIRKDVFAELKGGAFWRCRNARDDNWLAGGQCACA